MQYIHCSTYSAVHKVQYIQGNTYSALHTVQYIQCSTYSAVHTVQCKADSALCSFPLAKTNTVLGKQ